MPLFTSNLRTAGVWCIEFNASLRRKSIGVCERENIHAYIFIPIYKQQKKFIKQKGEFQGYLFKRRTLGQDSEPEGCQVLIERGL